MDRRLAGLAVLLVISAVLLMAGAGCGGKVEKGGAEEALVELLKGPTESEKQQGLFSPIPEGTRLNSYAVEGDTAKVDFSGELLKFGGGSAAVRGITAEINKTVLANDPRAGTVEVTIDGQPAEEVLQP